jgi:hypothetical protein
MDKEAPRALKAQCCIVGGGPLVLERSPVCPQPWAAKTRLGWVVKRLSKGCFIGATTDVPHHL